MDNSEDIFYTENKGGKIVLHDKYQYHLVRTYKSGASIMRCSNYRKKKCIGSITINDNHVIKKKEHTCEADVSINIILKEKAALKELARNTDVPIPKMYKKTLVHKMKDKGLHFVARIPSFKNMKHSLYDARNKAIGASKTIFKRVEHVEVPSKFNDFVLGDYLYNETRIILFCSQKSRQLIPEVREAFADSTFKSCPKPFAQLLSIHGDFGSTPETITVYPLIFVLMSNKKQSSYVALLEIIKSELDWKITKLHCDFEIAFINAVNEVFPEITIVGCYYHWIKNVWRKAKQMGHKTKDENRIVELCAALPLLPANAIFEGWTYIKTEYENSKLIMPKFTKYIERFMNKKNFVMILSVYAQRHRTNNVVESWHSSLNKDLNKNTVTLLRLLNNLVEVNEFTEIKIYLNEESRRKKHHIMRDDLIRNIINEYINKEISLGHTLEKLR